MRQGYRVVSDYIECGQEICNVIKDAKSPASTKRASAMGVPEQEPLSTLPSADDSLAPPLRRLALTVLLGEDREIIIEHRGQDYRLRITSNDKLILTK